MPQTDDYDLDLGDGHFLDWVCADGNSTERVGAIVYHLSPRRSNLCVRLVMWAMTAFQRQRPEQMSEREKDQAKWQLQGAADEHLTLSPLVYCPSCGDHGFIRDGKWVRA